MLYTILFVPKYYIISSERMRVNPKGQYTIHVLFYFVQLFYIYVFAAIHTASEMYSHVFLYKLQPPCCRLSAMHFILCFVVKAIHMYIYVVMYWFSKVLFCLAENQILFHPYNNMDTIQYQNYVKQGFFVNLASGVIKPFPQILLSYFLLNH